MAGPVFLSEFSGDIIMCFLMIRLRKYFARIAPLHQFAHIEKRGLIRDPRSLLHVMSHNDDCILFFQCQNQLFYFPRGHGIKSGRRFIHQKDVRFGGERPCDAQPLLLTA